MDKSERKEFTRRRVDRRSRQRKESDTKMITSSDIMTELEILNFRHIPKLRVSPFGRVTLIGGKNGVGKTTLLEALWQFTFPRADLALTMDHSRGLGQPEMMEWRFMPSVFRNDAKDAPPIEISANWMPNGGRRSLKLELVDNFGSGALTPLNIAVDPNQDLGYRVQGAFTAEDGKEYNSQAWPFMRSFDTPFGVQQTPMVQRGETEKFPELSGNLVKMLPSRLREPPQSTAQLLGNLELTGEDGPVIDFLRHIEPALTNLKIIPRKDAPVVHAVLDGGLPIPVNLVGEGFTRLLELSLSAFLVEDGLLLVDEIENGLHFTVYEDIFASLYSLAEKRGFQVVATTHSRELVMAAYNALKDKPDDALAYHRLDSRKGELSVASFDMEMLETSDWFGMEVR